MITRDFVSYKSKNNCHNPTNFFVISIRITLIKIIDGPLRKSPVWILNNLKAEFRYIHFVENEVNILELDWNFRTIGLLYTSLYPNLFTIIF